MREYPLFKEMTPRLFLVALISSLAAMNSGYEGGYFSTVIVNQNFLADYGHAVQGTLDSKYQSSGSGLGMAGIMLGAILLGGPISEHFGRKWGLVSSSVISIVGAIIQSASVGKIWGFIIGRMINNMGAGIANAIVPIYLAECSPSSIRGGLTSFYQIMYTFGQFWAYLICFLTKGKNSKWSYLLVVVLQVVIPTIMCLLTPFLVESPRWLIQVGKKDQALHNLNKIYADHHDKPKIIEEWDLAYKLLTENTKKVTYLDLFTQKNLRRTLLSLAVPCFLNGQGLSFMSNYLVLFLVQMGLQDSVMILVILMSVLLVTNTFSLWGADRLGRRVILLTSSLIMGSSLYIVAGCSYYGDTKGSTRAALGFLFIWSIIYGMSWAPMAHITVGEIPSALLREKTLAITTFFSYGISLMISFVNPFMQNAGYGNLQGRIGFVYGSVSFLAFIYVYCFLPELKGLSLEATDILFERKTPTHKFQEEGKKIMQNDDDYVEVEKLVFREDSKTGLDANK